MRSITVKKVDLQKTLQSNLQTHKADFDIIWAAYQKQLVAWVEGKVEEAKNIEPGGKEFKLYGGSPEAPRDHSEEYERAIEMLQWEVGDEVKLDQQEFTQYVQDDWDWKESFRHSNMTYSGKFSASS